MESYQEFMPKSEKVCVGDKELEVKEYTIAKRDAVLNVLLANLDVVNLLKPFIDAIRSKTPAGEIVVNVGDMAGQLKNALLELLAKNLTIVSCITLDTPRNRKELGFEDQLAVDAKYGYSFSQKTFDWTKENLTARQEQKVVEVMLKVNDFIGLVKNYWTLVTGQIKAARELPKEQTSH